MWKLVGILGICVALELSEVHRVAREVAEVGKRLERVR